ncbi:MAG: DUF805 domain-containing protein [Pseudomonadota bacterium]
MNNPYAAPTAGLDEPISQDGTYTPKVFAVNGRIGRLRYLAYSIGQGLLLAAAVGLLVGFGGLRVDGWTIKLIQYGPGSVIALILARRRLQDLGQTPWLSIPAVIPYLNILLGLYLLFAPGDDASNQYGPAPGPNTRGVKLAAWIVPAVAIIGIVAAVSIPAYQGYMKRGASHSTGSKL